MDGLIHGHKHVGMFVDMDTPTNRLQTGYRQGTDRVQTGYRQGTDRVQTGYRQGTDRVQTGYRLCIGILLDIVMSLCIDMCIDMCTDMRDVGAEQCISRCGLMNRHWCTDVCRHVYNMCTHMCGRVWTCALVQV